MNTTTTINKAPIARRLLVNFVPQAWIANTAIPIGQPEAKDATEHLLQLSLREIHSIKDRDASSDEFVDAVAWAHYGPFEVEAVDAVKAYFSVGELSEITQEMLDAARAGELPANTSTDSEDRTGLLSNWMLTYGEHTLLFACEAENVRHAIEQCENANPGERVIGAFLMPTASECSQDPTLAAHVQRANNLIASLADAAMASVC